VKIEMDLDEFSVVMRNTDAWERLMKVKFVEAEIGDKVIVKAIRVATPSFFVLLPDEKLMVEIIKDGMRLGYVDIEELIELDGELLTKLRRKILAENCEIGEGRFFPKSEECVELFKELMKSAR
jgi:hypothetical protein